MFIHHNQSNLVAKPPNRRWGHISSTLWYVGTKLGKWTQETTSKKCKQFFVIWPLFGVNTVDVFALKISYFACWFPRPRHANFSSQHNLSGCHAGFYQTIKKIFTGDNFFFPVFTKLSTDDLQKKPHKIYHTIFFIFKLIHLLQPNEFGGKATRQEVSLSQSLVNWHEVCCECTQPCPWQNDTRFRWQLWPAFLLGPFIAACSDYYY